MSEKPKKKELRYSNFEREREEDDTYQGPETTRRQDFDSKRIRRLNPLGLRVLVRLKRDTNVTDGGLYLPEGAKQSTAESLLAEVLEVASATDEHSDEETNISGIPQGALVLIPKFAGIKVPWDEDLRIVETKEVLAIVNEISVV